VAVAYPHHKQKHYAHMSKHHRSLEEPKLPNCPGKDQKTCQRDCGGVDISSQFSCVTSGKVCCDMSPEAVQKKQEVLVQQRKEAEEKQALQAQQDADAAKLENEAKQIELQRLADAEAEAQAVAEASKPKVVEPRDIEDYDIPDFPAKPAEIIKTDFVDPANFDKLKAEFDEIKADYQKFLPGPHDKVCRYTRSDDTGDFSCADVDISRAECDASKPTSYALYYRQEVDFCDWFCAGCDAQPKKNQAIEVARAMMTGLVYHANLFVSRTEENVASRAEHAQLLSEYATAQEGATSWCLRTLGPEVDSQEQTGYASWRTVKIRKELSCATVAEAACASVVAAKDPTKTCTPCVSCNPGPVLAQLDEIFKKLNRLEGRVSFLPKTAKWVPPRR